MKNLFSHTIFFCLFFISTLSFSQEKLFSIEEQKADIAFYKKKLKEIHPNYDFYTIETDIDLFFDSLALLITSPNTALDFYKIITLTSSRIKDGHTLILPDTKSMEFHNKNSKFLPFQLSVIGGKLYVRMNCTMNNEIPDGAEINSINDFTATEILTQLRLRQVRDGNNLSYAYWILDNYFRDYYSYIFGHPENYIIHYSINNETKTATIKGLPKDSIFHYRKLRYPSFSMDRLPGSGITSLIDTTKNFAMLSIKDFHNDILKNEYQQEFNTEVRHFFHKLIPSKISNLLIDLRNNQGGDIENGITLLSYLSDIPFTAIKGYYNKNEGDLKACKGPKVGVHKPKKKIYSGRLFVLINGGSFSNSGIVASCLKENSRATFLGSESGGNPAVLAGFSDVLELPNTKINVQIPTKRLLLTSIEKNTGKGLKPDFYFHKTVSDILSPEDDELEWAIETIFTYRSLSSPTEIKMVGEDTNH